MGEIVVSLRNVSKCFSRYARPVDRLKELLLPTKHQLTGFWALRDINLEIAKGEALGIIGRNGSGKSTLLQIIAGTLMPTTGTVCVNGRVSALLELGSGFNPEFTGRQNVFFNGRLLGLSQRQVEEKFDRIAAFADIGDFIDQPVKIYSSGMFVRLAFAVAIHVEPEVLIVDEALAVGDIFFQQKCYKFLEDLRSSGASIIFVSHDTQAVMKLCDRGVILQDGCLKYTGLPSDMAAKYTEMYYSQFLADELEQLPAAEKALSNDAPLHGIINSNKLKDIPEHFIHEFPESSRYGCMSGLIEGLAITNRDGNPCSVFQVGEDACLSIKVGRHPVSICPLNIGFQIKNKLGQILIGTNTCFLAEDVGEVKFGEMLVCQFKFNLALFPGQYTLVVAISEHDRDAKVIYDWIEGAGVLDVISEHPLKQVGLYFPEILVSTTHPA